MNLTTIKTNTQTILAAVSGVRGADVRHPDTIPVTPWYVIGQAKGTIRPGERRITDIDLPFRLYVSRTADEGRTAKLADDLLEATITAFETVAKSTLSGAVTFAGVREFDTDNYYEVGGEEYLAIDFVLAIEAKTVTYAS